LDDSSRIHIVRLDVEDQASIEQAGADIRDKFDRVDLLLNVAVILGDAKNTPGPERSLAKMDREWLEKSLAVNLIGPVMFSKELSPLIMQRRGRKADGDNLSRPTAVIANLSARVGSISDNGLGGWYSYRMSKAALNQATRTMALELKRNSAWTVALHPGTTNTGLSEPFQGNVKEGSLFPVDFTVTQLLNIIDSMQEENSGGFYDWSGQALSF
jgi:NAD(P)-dependent dehydrogenase (short-subunit alcohol dehydrogenase family)